MGDKMDFECYLGYKNDEIDNASYLLAAALLRTSPGQANEDVLAWDMSIIAPVIEAAQEKLELAGMETCWPFYGETSECYLTGSCKNKQCRFINHKEG